MYQRISLLRFIFFYPPYIRNIHSLSISTNMFTIQSTFSDSLLVWGKVSFRELIWKFILSSLLSRPTYSQYWLSWWTTLKNFKVRNIVHARHGHNLFLPGTDLAGYQNGVNYERTKLCSALPSNIKVLSHDKKVLKPALKDEISAHPFYFVDDCYFQLKAYTQCK
jgi:hypothetical protein